MIRGTFLRAAAVLAPALCVPSGLAFAQSESLTTIRFAAQSGDDLRPVLDLVREFGADATEIVPNACENGLDLCRRFLGKCGG